MEIIFWISLISLVFIYILYAPILYVFSVLGFNYRSKKNKIIFNQPPELSIIIAAYNEESVIEDKILNTLALNYPKSKMKVYVVSDGSTDNTNKLVKKHPDVQLLYKEERNGKIHALNRAMKFVKSEITVFTDANCFLNAEALKEIVKLYQDPEVGAVSGAKQIWVDFKSKANAQGEGLYWKIEFLLKDLDFKFYTVVGAPGELFSIRTELFESVQKDTILDDFAITLNINCKGYRTAFAPLSKAYEVASEDSSEEFKRKVRIATGGYQLFFRYLTKINPLKTPRLFYQYYFRRVSRWVIAPFALITVLASNVVLYFNNILIYQYLLVFQLTFYLLALGGYLVSRKKLRFKSLLIPYYFTFMHLAVVKGFINYLRNKQNVKWDKIKRLKRSIAKEDLFY